MGAPPESDREAISGFECLHRVAQSYLGPLWIASDAREGSGALRLIRRLQLPDDTPDAARREIAALGQKALRLRNANVLGVVEVLEQGELLAMVYEHAEAEPLRSLQSWANLRGLSFPVGVALRIIADLLHGLQAVHDLGRSSPQLTVAGGLSPDSVLVVRDGNTLLCDPLIANGAALLDGVGFNTAKLAYASPEQVHAVAGPTPQSDVFTSAAMLWELLAARRLLAGSRPAIERKLLEHNLPSLRASLRAQQQVSDELVALVERALAADPAARPASAGEFASALGACGHEPAGVEDVAAFVGKLSGPRFDRRTAAIRSRSALPLDDLKLPSETAASATGVRRGAHPDSSPEVATPRADSFVPSTERNDEPFAPAASARDGGEDSTTDIDAAPPSSVSVPISSTFSAVPRMAPRAPAPAAAAGAASPASPASPPGGAQLPGSRLPPPPVLQPQAAPAGPALWETILGSAATSPATPQPASPSPATHQGPPDSPPRGRTITGLGGPQHPALAVNLPFANLTPSPFEAVREPGAEDSSPDATPAVPAAPLEIAPFGATTLHAEPGQGPMPFEHLMPKSKRAPGQRTSMAPGQRTSFAPGSQSYFDLAAQPSNEGGVGAFIARNKVLVGVLAAAIGGAVAWFALSRREPPQLAAESTLPTAAEPTATSPEPASATPAPAPPPSEPKAAADAGAPTAAPSAPATPAPPPAPPAAKAADFAAAKLDDSQLVVLFELEGKTTLPSCAERLGDTVNKYTGNDMRRSQLQVKAARRQLARGDAMAAHELACSAVAHSPRNPAAQRVLGELALQLGDPAQAKTAIDRALARTPKDKALLALRGDVLALMGDIAGARAVWMKAAPARGTKVARTNKLVLGYKKLGDKALSGQSWAEAAALFRRNVILTRGNVAQSVGLSEALLWLDHSRAALVWAERAAHASPKDSRIQLLFGDALHENGQNDKARVAWQAALDFDRNNRLAARRLREGKP